MAFLHYLLLCEAVPQLLPENHQPKSVCLYETSNEVLKKGRLSNYSTTKSSTIKNRHQSSQVPRLLFLQKSPTGLHSRVSQPLSCPLQTFSIYLITSTADYCSLPVHTCSAISFGLIFLSRMVIYSREVFYGLPGD